MEEDATNWRLLHIETKCTRLESNDDKMAAKMTDNEKSNIRTEAAVASILAELVAVKADLKEIKEKPAKDYSALKLIGASVVLSNVGGIVLAIISK